MTNTKKPTKAKTKAKQSFPQSLRIPDDMKKDVRKIAAENGVSIQDTIRMAIARGLPALQVRAKIAA